MTCMHGTWTCQYLRFGNVLPTDPARLDNTNSTTLQDLRTEPATGLGFFQIPLHVLTVTAYHSAGSLHARKARADMVVDISVFRE